MHWILTLSLHIWLKITLDPTDLSVLETKQHQIFWLHFLRPSNISITRKRKDVCE